MPEEREIPKHDDLYQATVYTWGVKPKNHKLTHQAKVKLFGGNVGHAAIEITFPANERGERLISQYIEPNGKTLIPYEIIEQQKPSKDEDSLETIKYYKVYFSVWPANLGMQNQYLSSLIEDQLSGRKMVHYDYEKFAPNFNKQEIQYRTSKGILNALNPKLISLQPMITIIDKKLNQKIEHFLNNDISTNTNDLEHDVLVSTLIQFKQLERSLLEHEKKIFELKKGLKDIKYKKLSKVINALNKLDNDPRKKLLVLNKLPQEQRNAYIEFFDAQEEIEVSKRKATELELEIAQLYQNYSKELNLDAYIKIGKKSDGLINLPIIDHKNSNHDNMQGLNLEALLRTMKKIAEDNKESFDLHKKNCSSTVLTILNSGIASEDKKTIGKHVPEVKNYQDTSSPFFKMLTPQSVYNAASSMEEKFMQRQGITTKEQSIKKAIRKLQNSKKPISIKLFTQVLAKIKKYFATKKQKLKTKQPKGSLLFRAPYKKDAKTEETTPLSPKRRSRN